MRGETEDSLFPAHIANLRPLNLLDRHIFKSALFASAAAVGLFAFVLTMGNVIRDLLGFVLAGQMAVSMAAKLVLLIVPAVLSYALPFGILTGVLLTLGRLSSDNEITAMRAAGISMARIARPVFLLGILGALLGLRVNFESMPWSRVEYHRDLAAAVRSNPISLIVPKTFTRSFPGYVLYVGSMKGAVLNDFWLWQLDGEGRAVRFLRAESAHVRYDEESNNLILIVEHARIETRNLKKPEDFSESPEVGIFEQSDPVPLSLDQFFGVASVQHKPEWLTYQQSRDEQIRLALLPQTPVTIKARTRLALIIQQKATLSVAAFSFAFVGVALGITVSRRETSANLGIAVALALGYYFLTVMVGWLEPHPEYRPDLLMWVPNLIFLFLGWRLMRRIERG